MQGGAEKSARKSTDLADWGCLCLVGVMLSSIAVAFWLSAPAEEPPPLPEAIPRDVAPFGSWPVKISLNRRTAFIVPYGEEASVEVYFDSVYSIKRLWSGSNARLTIRTRTPRVFAAKTRSKSWDNLILTVGSGTSPFQPWLEASFPVEESLGHGWVEATAELEVAYPAPQGTSSFFNRRSHLKQEFRFFVVSPAEYELLEQHRAWNDKEVTVWGLFFLILFTLAALMFFYASYRVGKVVPKRG